MRLDADRTLLLQARKALQERLSEEAGEGNPRALALSAAVDALPDLTPLAGLDLGQKNTAVFGLRRAGITIPSEALRFLGFGGGRR